MQKDAKEIMEEGWKARENLEFEKAEKLLTQAVQMFEEAEDWFNVTEALNHLAYTQRLKALHHNLKGLEYAKKSEDISNQHSTKKPLILRTLMSLTSSAGLYEQALKHGQECLELTANQMPRADILSHLAIFHLRTGNLLKAEEMINEAESIISQHFDEEREPHRSIWKSKILYTKGIVLYNKNDLDNAKKYFLEALDIAKKNNLKTRIDEVTEMMNLL